MATNEEVLDQLAILADALDKEPRGVDVYLWVFKDTPIETLRRAVKKYIQNSDSPWYPTAGQLAKLCKPSVKDDPRHPYHRHAQAHWTEYEPWELDITALNCFDHDHVNAGYRLYQRARQRFDILEGEGAYERMIDNGQKTITKDQ